MILTALALLISVSVAAAVLTVAMVVRDLRRPRREVERRLGLVLEEGADAPTAAQADKPSGHWIDRAFYRLVEGSGSRLGGPAALALVAGLAIVGCAVPLVLVENLLAAMAGTVLGVSLPLCWWAFRRMRRQKAMQKALPETLDLIADSVRSGQTLEHAVALVAAQAPKPLSTEFGYCSAQLKLGQSPVAVLQRMSRRVPLPEFKTFSTAVLVHRQTGGNLALLAQRLARSARDRSEFHGHLSAVTAGHRMSVIALVVGTLVALGALASLQAEYLMSFLQRPIGPVLLAAAGVLQIIGMVWVWRILKVRF